MVLTVIAAVVQFGCTNPFSPTETETETASATLLAFGFPAQANPAGASAQLPITLLVDGRVVGSITTMWTSGLLTDPGPGRLQVPVAPGAHTYAAFGTSSAWEDSNVVVTEGQAVVRHLLCNPCTVSATDLRNFGVFRALQGNTLEVCVRDHECEDGDRVSVTLNGQPVFANQKIFNAPTCRTVPARTGLNLILFRADNGTGFEGACSHSDENTGQITVRGADRSGTQTWSLRGGAGTQARLAVVQ
jgi:hypothetical protein